MAEVQAIPVTAIEAMGSTDDGAHALLKIRLGDQETVLAIQNDHLRPLLSLVCDGISQTAAKQQRSERAVFQSARWDAGWGEDGSFVMGFRLPNGTHLAFQLDRGQIPHMRETLQVMEAGSSTPPTPNRLKN